jgi:hypothetical protein
LKKLIFVLLFFLFYVKSFGQSSTEYDTCHYLQQFEGEWKYVKGTDTLKVYLRFHRRTFTTESRRNLIKDFLIGWHEYKKGNSIIESDYQYRFIELPADISDIYDNCSVRINFDVILNPCSINAKKLHGFIKDYLQANQDKEIFATLNETNTTMTCKLWHGEWVGHGNGMIGMTLPANFVLVKQ